MAKKDIIEKLEYYSEQKSKIHLSCKNNQFYNGIIIDLTSNKHLLVFLDQRIGEVPILFEEILRIEPFKESGGAFL